MITARVETNVVSVVLDREQVETLIDLAHHYEKVMGFFGPVVSWTSPRRVRRRFRFIILESDDLEQLYRGWLPSDDQPRSDIRCEMSHVQAVATWGRILANLRTKRSRRKLSDVDISKREQLSDDLRTAMTESWATDRDAVKTALETRRPVEADWMKDLLDGAD